MTHADSRAEDWQLHHARQLGGLQAFLEEEPKAHPPLTKGRTMAKTLLEHEIVAGL